MMLSVLLMALTLVLLYKWGRHRPKASTGDGCLSHVPGPARDSWIKGNLHQLFNAHAWGFHEEIAKKYGGAVKVHGILGDEQLYVSDPLALQHIVARDQYSYEPTSAFLVASSNAIMFGPVLPATGGEHHKQQRRLLHPFFTTRSVREQMNVLRPILQECCDLLTKMLRGEGAKDVDMFNWMSRVSLECVAQGTMGTTFNSLKSTTQATDKYMWAMEQLIPTYNDLIVPVMICPYLVKLGSTWFRRLMVDLLPFKSAQRMKDVLDTMHRNATRVFKEKKAAFLQDKAASIEDTNPTDNLMSIYLQAHLTGHVNERLPENEAIGQTNLILWAGHDNTTSSLCRLLWVLGHNFAAQERLRDEIKVFRKLSDRDPDYDELISLPYLDAVIKETLRLYPPLAMSLRMTTRDIVLPLLHPIPAERSGNGRPIQEIFLKKDTGIIISMFAANRSKTTWGEDAEEWKPERWMGESNQDDGPDEAQNDDNETYGRRVSKERLPGVYSGMMTFLGGWRGCVGVKFAELELKIVLSMLIEKFRFEPADEVYFTLTNFSFPIVKGSEDGESKLPLKVSLVQE